MTGECWIENLNGTKLAVHKYQEMWYLKKYYFCTSVCKVWKWDLNTMTSSKSYISKLEFLVLNTTTQNALHAYNTHWSLDHYETLCNFQVMVFRHNVHIKMSFTISTKKYISARVSAENLVGKYKWKRWHRQLILLYFAVAFTNLHV